MKRSKFNLSHTRLLSCDMGELVPCGLVEVLPGDTFQHGISALIRAAPLLAPVMHPVHVRVHCFFVPHRLIWEDWEDFITGGPDGMDASVFPTINMNGALAAGTLPDYLGVPVGTYSNLPVSALPFRAYAMIWNEYYRDQDLQTEVGLSVASGVDATTNTALQNCAWEKDYFTAARPWEQKGPAITIPLGTTAPVVSTDASFQVYSGSNPTPVNVQTLGGGSNAMGYRAAGSGNWTVGGENVRWGPNTGLETDLTGASAVTVNLLREALALQRFEEARARYGSRYVEYLRYYGVRSSDARLQRPEYIGGVHQTIQFSEVLQTSVTGATPLGEMAGHGIAGMRGRRYRRFFEEHGYVVCLLSVRPKTMYVNGLERTWNRRTKEDFYQKELEHIGQQEVLNKEVRSVHASPNGVFGYQDRYDEYRRSWSTVHGEFATSTLNYWHFARSFGSDPALNDTFVECVPTEVPFAVPAEDVLYCMVRHNLVARRQLARTGSSFIF